MTGFIQKLQQVAQRHPDSIALQDTTGAVTYADLWQKTAALGTRLQEKNIGAEDVVGLRFEKSADYIVALLGVWYAGAAFAPLPPSLPAARLDYIIADANIRHFLTPQDVQNLPAANLLAPAPFDAGRLAYVMHTSGSTGTPKGVAVEQRGILNVLEAQIKAFHLTPQSRSLFYLSICFDASLSDIGTALLAGACLMIPPEDTLRNGAALVAYLHEHSITHADLPPALLRAFAPDDLPESLGTIIIGGETCPPETVRAWAKNRNIINVYGPTETTICTSLCRCEAATWHRPLLGDAFDHVDYIIDDGELLIGGIQIARGYLNLPALNAQKFVTIDGKKFYRTGDRVQKLPDGRIEFLGRIDRQFKLRGQLVEPDEIEACLHRHPAIRHAAVFKTAAQQLAACVVLCEGSVIDEKALKAHIAEHLPAWMVPANIKTLAVFPKTASGKTDYTALAQGFLPTEKSAAALPETPAEKMLFNICQRILGHNAFDMEQSFYAAGGDSLGVIRLLLETDRAGLSLPPDDIADNKSLRTLAQSAGKGEAMSADAIRKDVAFDQEWQDCIAVATARPANSGKKDILLTGATGFLGSRVLSLLLKNTDAVIHCPVRAESALDAQRRIQKTFVRYGIDPQPDPARVQAFPADLSLPQFGCDADVYARLCHDIDTIYHCAATVNMVAGYEALRGANITATQNILRLALTGCRKTLHYASTLSVFVGSDQNTGRLLETDKLENVQTLYGGYAQTKFAAEWMLLNIPDAAVPISHYRFGLITGDTTSGIGAAQDFLAMFARGISGIGYIPAEYRDRLRIDITPIDYAAKAMVQLATHAPCDIYHIANTDSLSLGFFADQLCHAGFTVKDIPADRFAALTQNRPLDMVETAASLALCRLLPAAEFTRKRTMDLFQATDVVFDTAKADAYLKPASITCPPVTPALIQCYLRRMMPVERTARICFFGPESTGKSTLSAKIAAHFNAPHVAEYAKELIEQKNGEITYADIDTIAKGHASATQKALQSAPDMIVCDTDALTTTIWSHWLFKDCPQWIEDLAAQEQPDITFLMDIDTPWVADIHRYLPEERESFLAACKTALEKQGRDYILLSGTWQEKFDTARQAIDALTRQKQKTGT